MIEQEIPKYKKKTKSNTSKSSNKAKHKHEYKECLLINKNSPYLASYCVICGKIYNWTICTEKCEHGYRMLNDEEVFEKYKNLEKYIVEDLWAKYLSM